MFPDTMQRLNPQKADITVSRTGRIDIRSDASHRMGLGSGCRISFFIDGEQNLYLCKDPGGLRPTSRHGSSFFRFYSAVTARRILALPDVPRGLERAGFRIGEPEVGVVGEMFPVITRRVIST